MAGACWWCASYGGGFASGVGGRGCRSAVAIAMASVFDRACERWPAVGRKPVLAGSLYGIALYVCMTYVVVRLSNAGNGGLPAWRWENLSYIAGHMLLVGIPCALGARLALAAHRDG